MTMTLHEFCWNELATTDVKKAKDFYAKVFGWKFEDIDTGNMTYTTIGNGNQKFAGMWEIPKDNPHNIPPHWMAYILVENVKDALSNATKNGAKEIKGVTEVKDMGKFAIITDPTGAHVALWEVTNKK